MPSGEEIPTSRAACSLPFLSTPLPNSPSLRTAHPALPPRLRFLHCLHPVGLFGANLPTWRANVVQIPRVWVGHNGHVVRHSGDTVVAAVSSTPDEYVAVEQKWIAARLDWHDAGVYTAT